MIRNDVELECPCCGDLAATADEHGAFTDGQPLECGCDGWVTCDSEEPAEVVIDPDGCEQCRIYADPGSD